MSTFQTMRDVPIVFRFSPQLEKDVAAGKAGSPGQVGRYVTHHKCPECGWFVPVTLEGRSDLVRLGLTFLKSEVVNGKLHFTLAWERAGYFVAAQCGHCGLDEAGVYVPKGIVETGGRRAL